MRKLTNDQILSILSLSKRLNSITSSSVANSNGKVFVDIHSVENATLEQHHENSDAIEEIFPDGTMISTGIHNDQADGSASQNFRVAGSTSACITFYTKKKPSAPTESHQENSHLDCTIDVSKVEPLFKPWTREQLEKALVGVDFANGKDMSVTWTPEKILRNRG